MIEKLGPNLPRDGGMDQAKEGKHMRLAPMTALEVEAGRFVSEKWEGWGFLLAVSCGRHSLQRWMWRGGRKQII